LALNNDFTRDLGKYGPAHIYRNKLIRLLLDNVCRVVCVCHGSPEANIHRVTLKPSIVDPSQEHKSGSYKELAVWDVDLSAWMLLDIHMVKNVEVES